MTTPEHTLVGILGAYSVGLHSRLGWTAIAFAGLVSNFPDLDGLPMLIDFERFESAHRVWGHNLLAILLTTLVAASIQFRFHVIEWSASKCARFLPSDQDMPSIAPLPIGWWAWVMVGVCAQSAHLICDMTVSGGEGLSDWLVRPLWPFQETGFVYPLLPWGDVGPTVIMMAGVIAIAKFGRSQWLAMLTLVLLCLYMVGRGVT